MNLVPLVCTKCGDSLDFKNSLMCKCLSCGTSHILIGSGIDKIQTPYSFYPEPAYQEGKIQLSLKMRLVRAFRESKVWFVTDEDNFDDRYMTTSDFRVESYYREIRDDQRNITIGIQGVRTIGDEDKGYPCVLKMGELGVLPVLMGDGKDATKVGDRVIIRVFGRQFQPQARLLSELITIWFETVPEMILASC